MRTYAEIDAAALDGSPFSNGTRMLTVEPSRVDA